MQTGQKVQPNTQKKADNAKVTKPFKGSLRSPKTATMTVVFDFKQEELKNEFPVELCLLFGPENVEPGTAHWIGRFLLNVESTISPPIENAVESIPKTKRALMWFNGRVNNKYKDAMLFGTSKSHRDALKTRSIVLRVHPDEKNSNTLKWDRKNHRWMVVNGRKYLLNVTFDTGSLIEEKAETEQWHSKIYVHAERPQLQGKSQIKNWKRFTNFATNWANHNEPDLNEAELKEAQDAAKQQNPSPFTPAPAKKLQLHASSKQMEMEKKASAHNKKNQPQQQVAEKRNLLHARFHATGDIQSVLTLAPIPWPSQTYYVMRRNINNTPTILISSFQLYDATNGKDNKTTGMEVMAECPEKDITGDAEQSWIFDLVYAISHETAQLGPLLRQQIDQLGWISFKITDITVPAPYLDPVTKDCAVILGLATPTLPKIFTLGNEAVRLITIRLLTFDEWTLIRDHGQAGREMLAKKFAENGTHHLSTIAVPSLDLKQDSKSETKDLTAKAPASTTAPPPVVAAPSVALAKEAPPAKTTQASTTTAVTVKPKKKLSFFQKFSLRVAQNLTAAPPAEKSIQNEFAPPLLPK